MVTDPHKAPDNMFQQPLRRLLFDTFHNVIKHTANLNNPYRVQSIKSLAQVIQSVLIIQNLLDNKSRDSLAELAASVHDPQAQRNDFSVDQKVDHFWIICLDQSSNNS